MQKARARGFTLIELLVVVGIIGILIMITTVAIEAAQIKSRDAKRLADLKQFRTALELFYNDQNGYPTGTNLTLGSTNYACLNDNGWQPAGCSDAYMNIVPKSPGDTTYIYNSASNTTYSIDTTLEGTVSGLSGSVELTPNRGIAPH